MVRCFSSMSICTMYSAYSHQAWTFSKISTLSETRLTAYPNEADVFPRHFPSVLSPGNGLHIMGRGLEKPLTASEKSYLSLWCSEEGLATM